MNYFFKKNNATLGPIPHADLLKIIDANTEVSEDGTQWILAKDIPALASALGVGKPLGPPPLPNAKLTPPPPVPPSMPKQRVMPPLQNPQIEKSGGLSLPMVLVGIAIVGLLIFVGVAYMEGPGRASSYTPSSGNIDDYNQDSESSSTEAEEKTAPSGSSYEEPREEAKPQKTQCITCDGTGKVYTKKCFYCNGKGRKDYGNGERTCGDCNGTGLEPVPCESCGGNGWVND